MIDKSVTPNIIHIFDTNTQSPIKSLNAGLDNLISVQWVSDERILLKASIAVDFNMGGHYTIEAVPTLQLIAMNTDGTKARTLLQDKEYRRTLNRGNVVSILPDDPQHILMTAYRRDTLRLIKMNVFTGEPQEIEKGGDQTTGWKVSRSGEPVIRFDQSSRGKWVKIKVRAPGSTRWKTLVKVRSEQLDSLSPIAPTDDPKVWYLSGRRPGDDKSAIWLYDLEADSFLEKVFGDDDVDVSRAFIDSSGQFIGATFESARTGYNFIDPMTEAHLSAIRKFLGEENDVLFEDVSRSGSHWLLHIVGPKEPGAHVIYDRENKRAEYINSINSSLRSDQLGHAEIVKYTSRDGLPITGYLTHPVGKRIGSAPTIVLPHGGPQERDYYTFDLVAQFLASRGYAVFQPNFRGSSGYGSKFETAGHGQWGLAMQDDVTDGVKYLAQAGKLDPQNVAIMGWSYGGYSALMGAVRDPGQYRCSVSINGVSDLPAMLKYDREYFGKSSEAYEDMLLKLGDPKDDRARLEETSPRYQAEQINIPVLLIAGEADKRVPIEQSSSLHQALLANGKSVQFVRYANADHSLYGVSPEALKTETDEDDDIEYAYKAALGEVENFLKGCLK